MRRNYKRNFNCNFCKSKHSESILNLGILPISNNFIEKKKNYLKIILFIL